jgi:hypothetical protein
LMLQADPYSHKLNNVCPSDLNLVAMAGWTENCGFDR